jgi:hypothetical protein
MRVIVHAPYGTLSQEVGLIHVLANYLRSVFPEVVQLKCNGVFSCCDRDGRDNWQRSMDSCLGCVIEQNRLAAWSGIASEPLSKYLGPEDIDLTRCAILSLPSEKMLEASVAGFRLFDLCRISFRTRFGVEVPDLRNKNHVQVLRRMMLSAARAGLAVRRFLQKFMPDISLVADGRDLISRSFIEASRQADYPAVIFRWDQSGGGVNIVHPRTHQVLVCDLRLEGIATMRSDIYSWPVELIEILQEILAFLDIADMQMTLPIAR